MEISDSQKAICIQHGAIPNPCNAESKLRIALETIGTLPVNGMRHKADDAHCGWSIWCGGTLEQDDNFFKPMHISHVNRFIPEIQRFLALPPGYRFLLAGAFEKVWFDAELIMT